MGTVALVLVVESTYMPESASSGAAVYHLLPKSAVGFAV